MIFQSGFLPDKAKDSSVFPVFAQFYCEQPNYARNVNFFPTTQYLMCGIMFVQGRAKPFSTAARYRARFSFTKPLHRGVHLPHQCLYTQLQLTTLQRWVFYE